MALIGYARPGGSADAGGRHATWSAYPRVHVGHFFADL